VVVEKFETPVSAPALEASEVVAIAVDLLGGRSRKPDIVADGPLCGCRRASKCGAKESLEEATVCQEFGRKCTGSKAFVLIHSFRSRNAEAF
jgi:hypothetical protein